MEMNDLPIPFITTMRPHILFVYVMEVFPCWKIMLITKDTNAVFPFYPLKNLSTVMLLSNEVGVLNYEEQLYYLSFPLCINLIRNTFY